MPIAARISYDLLQDTRNADSTVIFKKRFDKEVKTMDMFATK